MRVLVEGHSHFWIKTKALRFLYPMLVPFFFITHAELLEKTSRVFFNLLCGSGHQISLSYQSLVLS